MKYLKIPFGSILQFFVCNCIILFFMYKISPIITFWFCTSLALKYRISINHKLFARYEIKDFCFVFHTKCIFFLRPEVLFVNGKYLYGARSMFITTPNFSLENSSDENFWLAVIMILANHKTLVISKYSRIV